MQQRGRSIGVRAALLAMVATVSSGVAAAQTAPPDRPTVRVGGVVFADYSIQQEPDAVDADGNEVTPNAFTVARAYINVTGTWGSRLSFRITPDIVRETGTGTSANGSQIFRLKYAFGQVNVGEWIGGGAWVRLGIQQTPWIDFMESAYRYRFQGPIFEDREGFLSSSDAGLSFRYAQGTWGEIHTGLYNGETYARPEANDQKAFMTRATVRPFAAHPVLGGLRLTGFIDRDAYVSRAERNRAIAAVTFEHPRVHAGGSYLAASDQTRAAAPTVDASGFSVWVTPRLANGWEALLRHDRLRQDQLTTSDTGERRRTIAGVAYWVPVRGGSAAVMLDVENVRNRGYAPLRRNERRWALHTLISF